MDYGEVLSTPRPIKASPQENGGTSGEASDLCSPAVFDKFSDFTFHKKVTESLTKS